MNPVLAFVSFALLAWLLSEIANAIIYVVFVAVVSFVAALLLKAVIPAAVHVWKCSSEYLHTRIVAVEEEYEAPPPGLPEAPVPFPVRPPRVNARVPVAPPAVPRSVRPPTLPSLTMVRPPTYVSAPFPRALTSTPRSAFPRSSIVPRAFALPAVLAPPVPLAPADEVYHMDVDADMMDCDE